LSKDQAYGGIIFIVALVVAIGYIVAFFAPYLNLPPWWREWAVYLPVFLFVLAALVICMWIGWTMLTTPPPAPIEPETLEKESKHAEGEKAS
jgi:protein-S-isoprenylcysteine O-methyltransferase Ste14